MLSALLYGSKSRALYSRHVKQLDQFHIRSLRKIMKISWEDHIPNTEVLQRARMSGIEAYIRKSQLRWTGHVLRMDNSRLPKQIFFSELSQGGRSRVLALPEYKDTLKVSLKTFNIFVTK